MFGKLVYRRHETKLMTEWSWRCFASQDLGGRRNSEQRYRRRSGQSNLESGPAESNSFSLRAEGQRKLKEFLKHVHPDFFGNAPDKILKTNSTSVQELNEYFQTVKNFRDSTGLEQKILAFYIQKEESDKFQKFEIDLDQLKHGSSPEIKQKHFSNVVETLTRSLE